MLLQVPVLYFLYFTITNVTPRPDRGIEYPRLVSSAYGQSNPNLFVFSPALPVASLLVIKYTPHVRLGHQIRRMFLRLL